jgi:hypothetical protein
MHIGRVSLQMFACPLRVPRYEVFLATWEVPCPWSLRLFAHVDMQPDLRRIPCVAPCLGKALLLSLLSPEPSCDTRLATLLFRFLHW